MLNGNLRNMIDTHALPKAQSIQHLQKKNAPQFRQFSSKIAHFQIKNVPQNHIFSSKVVNLQKKGARGAGSGRAKISPNFVENYQFRKFDSSIFGENMRRRTSGLTSHFCTLCRSDKRMLSKRQNSSLIFRQNLATFLHRF